MSYYQGNTTASDIGILPAPYYWWEAGAVWGAMLDYYHYTNDSTYNEVTALALLSQVGPNYDYVVPAQEFDEGNDDQLFWAYATMSAAEKNFPQPGTGNYSWLQLTENLWNTVQRRWDTSTCGGGLKWQVYPQNTGYNYKNSVSNGGFFHISARLARFTGNQTYLDWAGTSYNWSQTVGLINAENYQVYDGTSDTLNCSQLDQILWTYNAGTYLYGSAILYNYTNGSALWAERTTGFLNATAQYFSPFSNATNIMYEPACETVESCDTDEYSFKGYLSRWMWASTLVAPFTTSAVTTVLQTSAQAAAQSCSGPIDGVTCGQKWYVGGYDGVYGLGQEMSALETIQGLLVKYSAPPLHSDQVHLTTNPTTTVAPVPVPTSTAAASPSASKKSEAGAAGMNWVAVVCAVFAVIA
jgi:mannan endo-1,6-alpha-mannosidase